MLLYTIVNEISNVVTYKTIRRLRTMEWIDRLNDAVGYIEEHLTEVRKVWSRASTDISEG